MSTAKYPRTDKIWSSDDGAVTVQAVRYNPHTVDHYVVEYPYDAGESCNAEYSTRDAAIRAAMAYARG